MENETKKLLSAEREIDLCGHLMSVDDIEIDRATGRVTGVYYTAELYDGMYDITVARYEQIKGAIAEGAKFVVLGDDLTNINQIKRFHRNEARAKFTKYEEGDNGMREVIDEESLTRFMRELQGQD